MIINLKQKHSFKWAKSLGRNLTWLYHDFFYRRFINKLYKDTKELEKNFKHHYPRLMPDAMGSTACISCDLCSNVCPTKAINIKKPNLINFPDSIQVGEAPMHFYLDVTKCTSCHLCVEVCAVDALDLKGKYSDDQVDLVNIIQQEKALSESDSQD